MIEVLAWLVTPWIPLFILVATGVLLLPFHVRRVPHLVQVVVILTTGVVWGWMIAFTLSPIPLVHTLSLRGPLDMSIHLLLRLDNGHRMFAFIAATAALGGSFLLPRLLPPGRTPGPSSALFLLAGTLTITMAGNLLTLLLGWAITNAAYLGLLLSGGPRATWRTVGLVLLGGLLLWVVLAMSPPYATVLPWEKTHLPSWALVLLGLSVWLYLGAYPFHRQHRVAAPGVPAPWLWLDVIGGAAWLWYWFSLPGSETIWSHRVWLGLALFAAFGSALAAWLSDAPRTRLVWAMIQRTGLLLLVPLLGPERTFPAILGLVAAVVFAGGALLILHSRTLAKGQRVAYALALALFWGLPWTPGGAVRALLATLAHISWGLMFLLLIADALLLGSLLTPLRPPLPGRKREMIRVALFLGPALFVGFLEGSALSLQLPVFGWTTALPLGLGIILAWQRPRVFLEMRNWAWGMRVMAYLEPWETTTRRLTGWTLMGLGGIVALFDGAGWMAWLVLALLLILSSGHMP